MSLNAGIRNTVQHSEHWKKRETRNREGKNYEKEKKMSNGEGEMRKVGNETPAVGNEKHWEDFDFVC